MIWKWWEFKWPPLLCMLLAMTFSNFCQSDFDLSDTLHDWVSWPTWQCFWLVVRKCSVLILTDTPTNIVWHFLCFWTLLQANSRISSVCDCCLLHPFQFIIHFFLGNIFYDAVSNLDSIHISVIHLITSCHVVWISDHQ